MSKIGKKIINIPDGFDIVLHGQSVEVKFGDKSVQVKNLPFVEPKINDKELSFEIKSNSKQAKSNWGTMRALVQNTINGLKDGYEKVLEIEGVGFRAVMEGDTLVLSLGYSHPVKIVSPEGIKISVDKNTIKINGINKELVGRIAAEIRMKKKPEPYLGKGIHYQGEIIKRKAGKKVGAK